MWNNNFPIVYGKNYRLFDLQTDYLATVLRIYSYFHLPDLSNRTVTKTDVTPAFPQIKYFKSDYIIQQNTTVPTY